MRTDKHCLFNSFKHRFLLLSVFVHLRNIVFESHLIILVILGKKYLHLIVFGVKVIAELFILFCAVVSLFQDNISIKCRVCKATDVEV